MIAKNSSLFLYSSHTTRLAPLWGLVSLTLFLHSFSSFAFDDGGVAVVTVEPVSKTAFG